MLATGFDSNRGGIMAIDITGVDGAKLEEKWEHRVHTNFGLTSNGFPNMIFLYGPQSPAGFCNGPPTSAEEQGKIVVDFLEHLKEHGYTRFENTRESEVAWTDHLDEIFEASMFPKAKSWYWGGANVPGKPRQMLNYCGGLGSYFGQWDADKDAGYRNYQFS